MGLGLGSQRVGVQPPGHCSTLDTPRGLEMGAILLGNLGWVRATMG